MAVYIKITDRNWIIEQLASSLADRLEYVTYGTADAPSSASACYYMTYSSHAEDDYHGVKLAFFTHLEEDAQAEARFYDVASRVDHRVCMADRYSKLLRDRGFEATTTLTPGVDLQRFQAKLRVGVVGRTYHTGRKGEELVASVMDMPGIDWFFTGSGWPSPALHVSDDDLADFYRSLDYVLVPARYEGGPMPLIESLACGTPVIAPDVGFVERFPHLSYRTSDAADLRRVLDECLQKKHDLRRAVEDCTWDAWARGHDDLFRQLGVHSAGEGSLSSPAPVDLMLHGTERTTLGGPSLRVPNTTRRLRALGIEARCVFGGETAPIDASGIAHVHNVWAPESALETLLHARRTRQRVVFSPIYMNLCELDGYQMKLPAIAEGCAGVAGLQRGLTSLAEDGWLGAGAHVLDREPLGGYHARVGSMLELADHVVCLSRTERELLARYGLDKRRTSIVLNPVESTRFSPAGGTGVFAREAGLDRFVLCVGRIETRKNQLLLAAACRELGVPLVLIGHVGDPAYHEQVKRWGGDLLVHIDRLGPDDPLLAGAFREAACFALPSFAEGAPLAALEAAACGQSLLLSDRSSEQEYFGAHATYCDPACLDSIIAGLGTALARDNDSRVLRELVSERFAWDKHVRALAQVYRAAAGQERRDEIAPRDAEAPCTLLQTRAVSQVRDAPAPRVVVDITTSVHNRTGRTTGINRVEHELVVRTHTFSDTGFACWVDPTFGHVELTRSVMDDESLAKARNDLRTAPRSLGQPPTLVRGDHLIVAGSAWMQNEAYTRSVVTLVRERGLRLTLVVFDLVPILFPHWYGEGYTLVFERNLRSLCACASSLSCISESTRDDLIAFLGEDDGRAQVFTIGTDFGSRQMALPRSGERHPQRRPYALCVGAIHPRKNYDLLYNVWSEFTRTNAENVPDLVIVGGYGWQSEGLRASIERNPALQGRWHVLSDIDDRQLKRLYEGSLFTLYPSLYEGWGLPVAESLAHGKVCVASDRSSIPEIADASLVTMLDPLDTKAWYAKILSLSRNRHERRRLEQRIRDSFVPRTWSETVAEIHSGLPHRLVEIPARTLYDGEMIDLAAPDGLELMRTGWTTGERDGVFTCGHEAMLVWNGQSDGEDGLWIEFSAYLPRSGLEQTIDAIQDGKIIDSWTSTTASRQLRLLPVRRAAGSVVLHVHRPFIPHLVDGGGDMRELGIKLHRVLVGSSRRSALERFGRTDRSLVEAFRASDPRISSCLDPSLGCVDLSREGVPIDVVVSGEELHCTLSMRARTVDGSPVRATLEFNGVPLDELTVDCDRTRTATVRVPADVVRLVQPMRVRASLCSAASDTATSATDVPVLGLLSMETGTGLAERAYPHVGKPDAISAPLTGSLTGRALDTILDAGWYAMETGGVWSYAAESSIRLPAGNEAESIVSLLIGWIGSECPVDDVRIGDKPAVWRCVHEGNATGRLEVLVEEPTGRLSIQVESLRTPSLLGLSADARQLGVRLRAVSVAPLPSPGQSERISGWHEAEPAGVWTSDRSARLAWRIDSAVTAEDSVRVIGAGPTSARAAITTLGFAEQEIEVLVNGETATVSDVSPGVLTDIVFPIGNDDPATWHRSGQPVAGPCIHHIEFRTGALRSPIKLGLSEDARDLGICLHALDTRQEPGAPSTQPRESRGGSLPPAEGLPDRSTDSTTTGCMKSMPRISA